MTRRYLVFFTDEHTALVSQEFNGDVIEARKFGLSGGTSNWYKDVVIDLFAQFGCHSEELFKSSVARVECMYRYEHIPLRRVGVLEDGRLDDITVMMADEIWKASFAGLDQIFYQGEPCHRCHWCNELLVGDALEDACPINANTTDEVWECAVCHPYNLNDGSVYMCESCGCYYTDTFMFKLMNSTGNCPCPNCGVDIPSGDKIEKD